MIYQVVCVRDAALEGFARPFFVPSLGQAIRSFSDEIVRVAEDNPMSKHPEDYDLYHVGSFDDSVGELKGIAPLRIAVGAQLKR